MGRHYGHLSLEERCTIARLNQAGQSIRQIAAALDRSPSSISRDLKRNSGTQVGYKPSYAQEQGAACLAALPEVPLYAWVDGVVRDGVLIVIEVEVLEPALFMEFDRPSAERFAEATLRRL